MVLRILGQLLFTVGVMVGIAGAAQLPAEGARFPSSMPVALLGMAVGVAGLILWHLSVRKDRAVAKAAQVTQGSGGEGKDRNAMALLEALHAPALAFKQAAPALDANGLTTQADQLLEQYVLPFAEKRSQLIDHFGMGKGADILVTVAYGERLLNRVWSAAADGHLQEARACVPEAVDAFDEAVLSLQNASSS